MSVGFRAHHGTKIALVKVTNDLLIALHNWLVSFNVLLDFGGAFDINDPSILSQRVERVFGMKDTSLHWFRSYSSHRFQFVHVSDVLYSRVRRGYSEQLFSSFIDFYRLYTDDTWSYLSIKHSNKPRGCLKDIKGLLDDFLHLNLDKTEVIVFGPKHLSIILADYIITLDNFLQSSCHVSPFPLPLPSQQEAPMSLDVHQIKIDSGTNCSWLAHENLGYQAVKKKAAFS